MIQPRPAKPETTSIPRALSQEEFDSLLRRSRGPAKKSSHSNPLAEYVKQLEAKNRARAN